MVVASFNFPESELLAAIYGLAIRHAGIPVRLELGLGPRELVQPALEQGLVDLVPEYLGTALTSLRPHAKVAMADPAAVRQALARALARWHVQVLAPAAAQDQNGMVVTRATAARLRLRTVSDLRPGRQAADPRRPSGMPAAGHTACLGCASCMACGSPGSCRSTPRGSVSPHCSREWSTSRCCSPPTGTWPRGTWPCSPTTATCSPRRTSCRWSPTRRRRAMEERLVGAVNAVSARLTSKGLLFLNWRIEIAGESVLAEARGWLERQGLLPRPG